MIELIGECFAIANNNETRAKRDEASKKIRRQKEQREWDRERDRERERKRVQRTLRKRLHYIWPKRSYQLDGPFQFVFFRRSTKNHAQQLKTLPFVAQLLCICLTILQMHSQWASLLWQMKWSNILVAEHKKNPVHTTKIQWNIHHRLSLSLSARPGARVKIKHI